MKRYQRIYSLTHFGQVFHVHNYIVLTSFRTAEWCNVLVIVVRTVSDAFGQNIR